MKRNSIWPWLTLFFITILFFWRFFIKGLLPIPADIITGVYFPWLDLKFSQYPVGVPVKNALPSDVVSLTYPLREFAISQVKKGIVPFWNPFVLSGTALLANFQSAVAYPLNLLYLLSSNFALVWSWQVILQPILATIFFYLFIRTYRLNQVASGFGAFVWGFGGFFSLWAQYNTVIQAILWLPLVLFSLRKLSTRPVFGGLLSLSLFASFTAGNPPMTLIILLTAGLFCLFEFQQSFSKYLLALVYVLLGLGLSAPILLPSLTLSAASIRDFDHIAFSSGIKFLPWYKLITLVVPDYFGNPSTGNVWSLAGLYDNLTVFVGVVPFLLVFVSIWSKNKSPKYLKSFALTVLIISLLLIVKNPISTWLGSLTFLGLASMVFTRFSALTVFAVSLLSALAIQELSDMTIDNQKVMATLFLPLILIGLVFTGTWGYIQTHISYTNQSDLISHLRIALRNSLLPLAIMGISSVSLGSYFWLVSRFPRQKPNLLVLLILLLSLLTVMDLYRFFNKYNTFSPSAFLYPDTEIMSYARKLDGRFGRENDAVTPSNFWLHDRLPFASGYDTLHSLKYNQFLEVLNGGSILNVSSRYAEVNNPGSPLFDYLGIKNIITTKKLLGVPDLKGNIPFPYDQSKFIKVFESGRMAILENQQAFPSFFPVSNYSIATSSTEMQTKLLSVNLRAQAILTEDPHLSISPHLPVIDSLDNQGQTIKISISSSGIGLLATSQVADRGWQLKVDGIAREALTINHAFLGIPLRSGDKEILLTYSPSEFYTGLRIALLSVMALIGLALIYWKQDGRQN